MLAKEIEKKILTYRSILEIINAMKAFAGVNYRKCEERIHFLRSFEKSLYEGLGILLSFFPELKILESEKNTRLIIAFGSDQGLCGAYNYRIAEELSYHIKEKDLLVIIGRKLQESIIDFHLKADLPLRASVSVEGIRESLEEIFEHILKYLKKSGLMDIYLCFTTITEKQSIIHFERILPPDLKKIQEIPTLSHPPLLYLKPQILFNKFLEEIIFIGLYRAYLEALRSEAYFRIKSMETASTNIEKKITELQIAKHYQRQEEITSEIIEILIGSKL